jgi:hypothetical protein
MIRQTAFALLGVVALACAGWTAASAQDKPPGRDFVRPSPDLRPRGMPGQKMCFWRDAQSGGPFGSSGTCPAASSAAVGSRCGCYSKGRRHQGTIIAAPSPGSSQPVR